MAHHLSAKKRIRQTTARRRYNRYYAKTARNSVRDFRALKDKSEATEKLPLLISSIDKLVKRGIIHKNKAANLKSKLTKKVNAI
jgi:small subunit ribosomal protein S20